MAAISTSMNLLLTFDKSQLTKSSIYIGVTATPKSG